MLNQTPLTFRDEYFDTSTMEIGWERANLEKLRQIFKCHRFRTVRTVSLLFFRLVGALCRADSALVWAPIKICWTKPPLNFLRRTFWYLNHENWLRNSEYRKTFLVSLILYRTVPYLCFFSFTKSNIGTSLVQVVPSGLSRWKMI